MSDCLRILYVDDDPDIRLVATMSLELDPKLEVHGVGSAAEALTLVDAGDWVPDVILLDVMMPDMDGPALAANLRAKPALAEVPVLFMTARARHADVTAYRTLGAAGVIAKPFDPMSLAADLRRLVAEATARRDRVAPGEGM